MAPSPYRWYVGDLRTGKISRQVDLTGTWNASFVDPGALTGSFPLRSGEWPNARADTAPAKSFLAISYIDANDIETFLAGGPIWTTTYTDSTSVLQIGAGGMGTYFDHRKVMPVLAAGTYPATSSLTYTGAQLGLIAKQLLSLAATHTNGALPIVLPDDATLGGAGTTVTRTYPGYELGWIGERLKQLTQVQTGPELQFVPRRSTTDPRYIEWVARIGVLPTMMLTQTGPAWVFDATVTKSMVDEINVVSDGSMIADRVWAAGQGQAQGRPIIYADNTMLTGYGWPLLEGETTGTDTISDPATLTARANEQLSMTGRPIETWTLTVARDAYLHVGKYSPGDWCVVRVGTTHPYLPAGDYPMRILNKAGDAATSSITLNLSPKLGGI